MLITNNGKTCKKQRYKQIVHVRCGLSYMCFTLGGFGGERMEEKCGKAGLV